MINIDELIVTKKIDRILINIKRQDSFLKLLY